MAISQRQARPQQVYMAQQGMGRGGPSGLADVLEVLLDKGLVIDAFVRVSLVGIELLTIDARIVVASVDTYLRFAEAVNRLDLLQVNNSENLGDLVGSGSSSAGAQEGSRALKSRSSSQATPESKGNEAPARSSTDPDDSQSTREREDEPSNDQEPDASAQEDDREDSEDGKGIVSRIKERGQVF